MADEQAETVAEVVAGVAEIAAEVVAENNVEVKRAEATAAALVEANLESIHERRVSEMDAALRIEIHAVDERVTQCETTNSEILSRLTEIQTGLAATAATAALAITAEAISSSPIPSPNLSAAEAAPAALESETVETPPPAPESSPPPPPKKRRFLI